MLTRPSWGTAAFGLGLGVLAALHQFKVPPALPDLVRAYGYPPLVSGALMSVYALAGILFSWPVGRWFRRAGPAPLVFLALALLALGTGIGLGWPESAGWMLLGRFLEGTGFAVLAVVGGVLTTAGAPPARRMLATALWATWIPAGQVLSSLAARALAAGGRWDRLWWASLVATAALAVWGLALGQTDRLRLEPQGPAAPTSAETAPRVRAPLLLASGLFLLWALQFIAFMTWLPLFLVDAHGLDAGQAALVYGLPPVLIIAFNLLAGALLSRGVPLLALITSGLVAQAAVWFAAPATTDTGMGLGLLAIYGVASGIIPTCIFALPARLKGAGPAAQGFGALMTGRNLGVMVGPILLGELVGLAAGWDGVAKVFGGICALAVGMTALLRRHMEDPGQRY
ncbi:MFS transporter [Deferrisoma palaeochoriense]